MNKEYLDVPLGLRYISNWQDFGAQIPYTKLILNKVYPGCGMTTYFLTSPFPVIMTAPRKTLLQNKAGWMEKHGYSYFLWEASTCHNTAKRSEEIRNNIQQLLIYIGMANSPFQGKVYTPKVFVTIDSFPVVYKALADAGLIDTFTLLVDEFHVSFIDYEMKRDVIERFFSATQMMKNVVYLSATPIMEEYLDRMEVFNQLPYVELRWDQSMIKTPDWEYQTMKSTTDTVTRIINDFKRDGVFDGITVNGVSYNSTEAVFFINDVRNILNIIKSNALRPDEVNILISDCNENKKAISTVLGENAGYCIGTIPLEGCPHKTYTFCTKTVFFGCDFCSTNASTYVFADANLQNMTSDIALDLPQIAGRQRLAKNLFKDKIHIYVKFSKSAIQDYNSFKQSQLLKENTTDSICNEWGQLSQQAIEAIKVKQKKCPYGVIYQDPSQNDMWVAKKSENAIVAEDRAWKLRNKIYVNNEVFSCLLRDSGMNVYRAVPLPDEVGEFYTEFLMCGDSTRRMRMYCEFFDQNPPFIAWADQLVKIPAEYKNYYSTLGSTTIAKCGYRMSRIQPVYESRLQTQGILAEIVKNFQPGNTYRKEDIKVQLQAIYNNLGLTQTAKATDLAEYFNLADAVLTTNGVRKKAYKIIDYNERTIHAIQEYMGNGEG